MCLLRVTSSCKKVVQDMETSFASGDGCDPTPLQAMVKDFTTNEERVDC